MSRLRNIKPKLRSKGSRLRFASKRADRFYTSPAWRDYRTRHKAWTISKQGGVWCVVCGSKTRLVLDHDKERKDGGDDLPPFEEAHWHCHQCHQVKTAKARQRRAGGEAMKD